MTSDESTLTPPLRALFLSTLLVAAVALATTVGLADAPHPPGVFLKYTIAAQWSDDQLAARGSDYSPLYLALTRLLSPTGSRTILWVQCALHAGLAVAVFGAVAQLAALPMALATGLLVATYRPFVVYCGVHEPELLLLVLLAFGLSFALVVRRHLECATTRPVALLMGLANGSIALAATVRPQYLLLVPVWVLWTAWPATARRRRLLAIATASAVLVLAPALIRRLVHDGSTMVMNPGPVFYEGNGPAATGLLRHAPRTVHALESAHSESPDYGHVAYRRLAAAALGRPVTVTDNNRYWLGLTLDGFRAYPALASRRLITKAGLALMPREVHDLQVAEHLDRRIRSRLPIGFLPLVALCPLVALLRPKRLVALAGPLAVALVSILTQVVFYASARQRLPLALALFVAGAVAAADLWHDRLRVRRLIAVAAAVATTAYISSCTAAMAVADEVGWDDLLGSARPTLGERVARLHDGGLLAPWAREEQLRLRYAARLVEQGQVDEAIAGLEPILDRDLTIDDRVVGVPAFWLAIAHQQRGEHEVATHLAERALAIRPGEPLIAALVVQLARSPTSKRIAEFHPVGCDPITARWSLTRVATLLRRADPADESPSLSDRTRFPELP